MSKTTLSAELRAESKLIRTHSPPTAGIHTPPTARLLTRAAARIDALEARLRGLSKRTPSR